jgi:hypothetical protein
MDARCEWFDKSEHVAHIEPGRYWSSVQEMISKGKGGDEKDIQVPVIIRFYWSFRLGNMKFQVISTRS